MLNPDKVYELRDISDEEIYKTLGVFDSLETAKSDLLSLFDPHNRFSETDREDFEIYEIMERTINKWSSGYSVYTIVRKCVSYNEKTYEETWEVVENESA